MEEAISRIAVLCRAPWREEPGTPNALFPVTASLARPCHSTRSRHEPRAPGASFSLGPWRRGNLPPAPARRRGSHARAVLHGGTRHSDSPLPRRRFGDHSRTDRSPSSASRASWLRANPGPRNPNERTTRTADPPPRDCRGLGSYPGAPSCEAAVAESGWGGQAAPKLPQHHMAVALTLNSLAVVVPRSHPRFRPVMACGRHHGTESPAFPSHFQMHPPCVVPVRRIAERARPPASTSFRSQQMRRHSRIAIGASNTWPLRAPSHRQRQRFAQKTAPAGRLPR